MQTYSHQDEALRDELAKHLSQLERSGVLKSWHDRQIPPGSEWAGQIDQRCTRPDHYSGDAVVGRPAPPDLGRYGF